jgi:cobalamin biosynthesis protein CobT
MSGTHRHTLLKMEACKEYLLNRLNSHFRIDYDGFFFDNEKYNLSQIPQFIEEARKFTGYRFKIGFVCDNSNESNEDSHEIEEEEGEEEESSNGEDDDGENTEQNSEGRSDSEAEMNADSGGDEEEEEEETMCPECHRQYSSKSNLSRHMKSQH